MNTHVNTCKAWRTGSLNLSSQAGATLIELMIGLALSLIVTTSMVILMANSFGVATRIIHMSQLSDELRNSMSMITRDLRRANYSANGIFCYGNSQCGASGGISPQAGDVLISGECISFTLDRNSDGDAANDPVGGFRREETTDGIGVIEMYTGTNSTPCAINTGWFQLTDPGIVNVSAFEIDDTASFTRVIQEGETTTFTNRQRQITLALEGQVVLEQDSGINMVNRRIEDVIFIRNDYIVL